MRTRPTRPPSTPPARPPGRPIRLSARRRAELDARCRPRPQRGPGRGDLHCRRDAVRRRRPSGGGRPRTGGGMGRRGRQAACRACAAQHGHAEGDVVKRRAAHSPCRSRSWSRCAECPAELARWIRRPVPLRPSRAGPSGHRPSTPGSSRCSGSSPAPRRRRAGRRGRRDAAPVDDELGAPGGLPGGDRRAAHASPSVEAPFQLVDGRSRRARPHGRRLHRPRRRLRGRGRLEDRAGRRARGSEAEAAAVQLAAYRLAWHRLAGAPIEGIRAAFHYVAHNRTDRRADLLGHDELIALIRSVPEGAAEPL